MNIGFLNWKNLLIGGFLLVVVTISCLVAPLKEVWSFAKKNFPSFGSGFSTATSDNNNREVITFAPGETKKVIDLVPGQWTPWIVTPSGTDWRVSPSQDGMKIGFWDGSVYIDSPGSVRWIGVKRGIFKFLGNGNATVFVSPQSH